MTQDLGVLATKAKHETEMGCVKGGSGRREEGVAPMLKLQPKHVRELGGRVVRLKVDHNKHVSFIVVMLGR
ncbi:MAG: hypothetical protein RIF33_10170 [Cyclobacteriaceae bacterium]